jgi:Ca-activated chloride channel family protein
MTHLTARQDRRIIRPTARSHRYVLATVVAPPATRVRERAAVNLAFVLDRSGSMSGGKIELAKRAVHEAIERLDDRDRFSIVTYDEHIDVVAESRRATADARRDAHARLSSVEARGSTDLAAGWFRGCAQVAAYLGSETIDRVLLLTDGLANVGITDHGELARHAGELRARGVATTTFGVGTDFDEVLLQSMADAGGGHFYYIADANQIRDHIASEVGETLQITAREAVLEVLAGEGIRVEPITPHPLTPRGDRALVQLGDLVAEQVVEVVLRLEFPYGELGRETGVRLAVRDATGAFTDGAGTSEVRLTWAYADHAANDAQPRDVEVDRAVARQFAARARQEAVRANKAGDFEAARRVLEGTARRIRTYAARDATMRALIGELEAETHRFAMPMAAPLLKEAHFSSANLARSRDVMGRAVRRS